MFKIPTLTPRQYLIVAHDLIATAVAILASFFIRFEETGLAERLDGLIRFLPGFVVYAGFIYFLFGLHASKWRFFSLPDVFNIVKAATVLAVSLLVLDYILVSPQVYGAYFFGKITIALYWFMQIAFLTGSRVIYRQFRYVRTQQSVRGEHSLPTLILGRAADAEVLLRAIESGAVSRVRPVGILSPSIADRGQSMRGIPVVGSLDDLEQVVRDSETRGTHIMRLIFTPSALVAEAAPESTLMRARRLGLQTSRLPALSEGGEAVQLAPVAVEDLLLRDTVSIDYHRLEEVVRGKSIIVTGGGGSIGAEICDRVVTFGASRLLVVEHSEVALHTVLETLRAKGAAADIDGRIADVRDRERIMRVFADFKPEIVFHAAALKHVPLLERDWGEGVKTNVFGSVNVIDAAVAASAGALVMISTDKAIEPVSVLGATKRLAEMYAQALDADFVRRAAAARPAMRLIAVRFGNVLASNGSVVPKFKAQIEAGGPVTVTHPDMVRYFMTIREACDLVLTAASHALASERTDVSVYVLNMGQQVKIVELAERMIALSGLEPGRDIEITFTGVRPGERLHEILFAHNEPTVEIGIAGIVAAKPGSPSVDAMRRWLATLEQGIARNDRSVIYGVLRDAVPDFRGEAA
ncbi:MAG: nucleoside-diphosphate sugar epimerase/dehydratase [Alphaproteobacteria bacterium]